MSDYDKILAGAPGRASGTNISGNSISTVKSDNSALFDSVKKQQKLTEKEIELLIKLGIDPKDNVAVEKWRSMSVEQQQAVIKQHEDLLINETATSPTTQTSAQAPVEQPQAEETAAETTQSPKFDATAPLEAKPASLADMVKPSAPELKKIEINIDPLAQLQASMSEDKWKSFTQEQRLEAVKNALGDKFKDEIQNLNSEQKERVILGLVDGAIKKECGISDEKWDTFSDEKKMQMRFKYGTSFAISIQTGYTKEDLQNLSEYERLQLEASALEETKKFLYAEAEKSGLSSEEINNKAQNKYVKNVVSMGKTDIGMANMSKSISEFSLSIKGETSNNAEKKSFIKQFQEEQGVNLKDIRGKDKRKVEEALTESLKAKLSDMSASEREAFYKELLSSGLSGDESLSLIRSFNILGNPKGQDITYSEELSAVFKDLQKNADSTGKEQLRVLVENTAEQIDNKDTGNVVAIVADMAVASDSADAAQNILKNTEGSEEDLSDAAKILIGAKKEFSRGIGGWGQTQRNVATQKTVTAEISKQIPKSGDEFWEEELTNSIGGKNSVELAQAALEANNNKAVHRGLSKATPNVPKNLQKEYFQTGFTAAEQLPKEDAVESQKSWVSIIPEVHKDNQLDLYKVTMSSKYDEVIEYSSSNIHNLNASVQAEAIKATYETGNQKAIDACNSQMESCSKEAVKAAEKSIGKEKLDASRAQTEAKAVKAAVQEYAKAVVENNKINDNLAEPEDIKQLSEAEKKEYYVNYFLKATDSGRYNLLSKLSDVQLKDVISKLCKYNSSMIKGLVQQGLGKYVLQTIGKSPDVLYSTINIMLQKGGKDAKLAAEYILSNKSLVHFSDDALEKAEEILGDDNYKVRAANLNETEAQLNSETVQYISNPYGFAKTSLYPRMSDIYPNKKEMFYNA